MKKILLFVVCAFYMFSVHAQLTQKAIDQMFKTTWNPQKNKVGIWDDSSVSIGGLHSADADVLVTYRCFMKMKEKGYTKI